jgi:membrane protein DedA with SNARE-associated domain
MVAWMTDVTFMTELAAYGLIGAALLALAERLIPIVPSYGLFIFLGSALVRSPIDLIPLIIVTTLASTLGGLCWYAIGNVLGARRTHDLVKKYGGYVWLKEDLYLSLAERYSRNAFTATFIGQIIPVVRVYLSLPAGILALPVPTFALAAFLGSAIWVGGFTTLGYSLHVFGWNPATTTLVAVLVLLVVEGGLLWFIRRRKKQKAARHNPNAQAPD